MLAFVGKIINRRQYRSHKEYKIIFVTHVCVQVPDGGHKTGLDYKNIHYNSLPEKKK